MAEKACHAVACATQFGLTQALGRTDNFMQTFIPWLPVQHVPEFLAGVFVLQHSAGAMTIVCDGEFADGSLLVLRFENFEAVTTHKEFSHQWPGESDPTALPKSPGGYWTFPFLQVQDSAWAATSMQANTFGQVPSHYCILSASDIVDVLALEPPRIDWTTAAETDRIMDAASKLGTA